MLLFEICDLRVMTWSSKVISLKFKHRGIFEGENSAKWMQDFYLTLNWVKTAKFNLKIATVVIWYSGALIHLILNVADLKFKNEKKLWFCLESKSLENCFFSNTAHHIKRVKKLLVGHYFSGTSLNLLNDITIIRRHDSRNFSHSSGGIWISNSIASVISFQADVRTNYSRI